MKDILLHPFSAFLKLWIFWINLYFLEILKISFFRLSKEILKSWKMSTKKNLFVSGTLRRGGRGGYPNVNVLHRGRVQTT